MGAAAALAAATVVTSFAVPSTGTPPAGASPGARKYPADVLDLKNWSLTLPTGNAGDPDDVTPTKLPTYSSKFFQLNSKRNGVIFNAPVGGTTTKNSKYPRSELREMQGEEKAAWSNSSGTHTLTSRQAILAIPPKKPEIVSAQIHDGGDDVIQIRLEGKKLVAQYDDGKSETPIDTNYKLGTVFDIKIVAANSKIEVFYNGKKKADVAKSGSSWYFKAGAYSQSNTEKGDKAGAPGKVVIYGLKVSHSGGESGGGQSGSESSSGSDSGSNGSGSSESGSSESGSSDSGDDQSQGSDDAKPKPSKPKPSESDSEKPQSQGNTGPDPPAQGGQAASPAAKVPGREVWATGLDSGDIKDFQDAPWNAVAADLPSVVDSPTGSGKVLGATIPAGATTDDYGARSELVPDVPDFKPGDDFYFGLSMFLKDGFPVNASWQDVFQVKSVVDGSPPLELSVEDGDFQMCGGEGHPDGDRSFRESLGKAETGRWINWIFHVKFSLESSEALLQVWRDGKSVLGPMHPPGATMYPDGDGAGPGYMKLGYYRKSGIAEAGTVYFDNLTIRAAK